MCANIHINLHVLLWSYLATMHDRFLPPPHPTLHPIHMAHAMLFGSSAGGGHIHGNVLQVLSLVTEMHLTNEATQPGWSARVTRGHSRVGPSRRPFV